MNSAALSAAKTQLRSLMKQRLKGLSNDSILQQSKAVFDSLRSFRPYVDANRVGIYLAMPGGELQTDLIVRHALQSGKQVFVPYLHKSGLAPGEGPARLMDMVSLAGIDDYESLRPDKWGIPSIDAATVDQRQRSLGELEGDAAADATLDLILLPGVAFDEDPDTGVIRRLGHGKGFYDYFLHRYALKCAGRGDVSDGRAAVLLYALGLREQFLAPTSAGQQESTVPVGPHDQPLDGLFLGDGQVKLSANSGHTEQSQR
ncbi:5-formyltetrahydrofolate cyclo-ligase [Microdochium trichocladiopsis]|uniref:5-formyltetrahydrofolate cyclo-ligase n=1 Tax=Microdochium trichocladiopsis TaxID=1682393 RepID=A0A9P8Y8X5_9PEZI|nr:5-formyltetrahydrofolate cyclo-ligase [Microdochium trichocladiopsis]KAH7031131.1 5-formyltetrahydrofolate cyclo-ligase [Microdochium trichocladiopsis]